MARSGRNDVCGCGSGRKVKRCCGERRGPGPEELAVAYLAEQGRVAAHRLLRVTRAEFDDLFDEMLYLPRVDVSLQLDLPRLLRPALESLRQAIAEEDDDNIERLAGPAIAGLVSAGRRADLARAVLALVDAGRIEQRVAAVAMIDLSSTPSGLFRSSLLESLAVSVGARPTPSGLLVLSGA